MNLKSFRLTADELRVALEARNCDRCGACCRSCSIELTHKDIENCPVLSPVATRWENVPEQHRSGMRKSPFVIKKPCPFLEEKNHCSIYADRPAVCRRVTPSFMICHSYRIEESGIWLSHFFQEILVKTNVPSEIVAGLLFAMDPTRLRKLGVSPDVPTQCVKLSELVDLDYLTLFRRCNLRETKAHTCGLR